MSTSIVFHKDAFIGEEQIHKISFLDKIFTQESDQIGKEICKVLERKDFNKGEILLDLIQSDEIFYKPTRIFGMCNYFQEQINASNRDINIKLILRSEQLEALSGLADAQFEVEPQFIESDEEQFSRTPKGIHIALTHKNSQYDFLNSSLITIISLLTIATVSAIGSTIALTSMTGIGGFIVFFSCSVLLFEALYVAQKIRKKISIKEGK